MAEPVGVDQAYARVRLTGVLLFAAAAALTAIAAFVALPAYPAPAPFRWSFLAVAVIDGVACLLFHNALASGRPLRGSAEGEEPPDVAAQVARLSQVLVAMPFAALLLGFVLRVVLGGSVLEYLGFLAVTLALWALFFPRRAEFGEWVRLRTGGQE